LPFSYDFRRRRDSCHFAFSPLIAAIAFRRYAIYNIDYATCVDFSLIIQLPQKTTFQFFTEDCSSFIAVSVDIVMISAIFEGITFIIRLQSPAAGFAITALRRFLLMIILIKVMSLLPHWLPAIDRFSASMFLPASSSIAARYALLSALSGLFSASSHCISRVFYNNKFSSDRLIHYATIRLFRHFVTDTGAIITHMPLRRLSRRRILPLKTREGRRRVMPTAVTSYQ